MTETAWFLVVGSAVGAIDVVWWHLWRFRLYRQPCSVLEELTHLTRYGLFLGIAAALLVVDDPSDIRVVVLTLFGIDLVVTAVDVVSEPSSRAPLGGLPRMEYLVHILATFVVGAAAATFWWKARAGDAVLDGLPRLNVAVGATITAGLLALEMTLFARSRLGARASGKTGDLRASVAACCGHAD